MALADDLFLVREFARMAGVSVRTLHYYDEIGLLPPQRHTPGGHRLYRREDLLRLQQIVTLKSLGFSLDEIRRILLSPTYDLRSALEQQHDALRQRIAQMQEAADIIQRISAMCDAGPLDWDEVRRVIWVLGEAQRWSDTPSAYTADELRNINERAPAVTPKQLEAWHQQWSDVIAGFRRLQHVPPEHPDVQRIAAQMHNLIETFTGGDAQIRARMDALSSTFSDLPADKRPFDNLLGAFMKRALEIYETAKREA